MFSLLIARLNSLSVLNNAMSRFSSGANCSFNIEVAAYFLGHTVFNDIPLGVKLGFTQTSMKELDAPSKVQTELEGMEVAVHPRALQHAKAGSVLPCLFHKINALQRVTPIASLPFLGDSVEEVTQRRCWDDDILSQSIGGAPDPGAKAPESRKMHGCSPIKPRQICFDATHGPCTALQMCHGWDGRCARHDTLRTHGSHVGC